MTPPVLFWSASLAEYLGRETGDTDAKHGLIDATESLRPLAWTEGVWSLLPLVPADAVQLVPDEVAA